MVHIITEQLGAYILCVCACSLLNMSSRLHCPDCMHQAAHSDHAVEERLKDLICSFQMLESCCPVASDSM